MNKTILKTGLLSVAASLAMATGVSAATSGNVLTLTAAQDTNTGVITFSGTADLDVLAASCSLRDANDTEVIFGSTAVESGIFSGEFTAEVASYTLKCANYNSGVWVSAEIIGPESSAPSESAPATESTSNSPETGRFSAEGGSANADGAVIAIAAIGGIVLVAGVASAIIMKRRKAQK